MEMMKRWETGKLTKEEQMVYEDSPQPVKHATMTGDLEETTIGQRITHTAGMRVLRTGGSADAKCRLQRWQPPWGGDQNMGWGDSHRKGSGNTSPNCNSNPDSNESSSSPQQ